jgi:hypothetical protein
MKNTFGKFDSHTNDRLNQWEQQRNRQLQQFLHNQQVIQREQDRLLLIQEVRQQIQDNLIQTNYLGYEIQQFNGTNTPPGLIEDFNDLVLEAEELQETLRILTSN